LPRLAPSSNRTATLEGARSWQSQDEEKAKEVERLRVELAERATALATMEGQL
jgi:hypothetical protein